MRLTDEEMREVFARAEEIQRAALLGDGRNNEFETVIQAAEEVGLSRPAVERALRERFDLAVKPPAVGELTFARSADDKFYVAEVLSVSNDGVRVRFLRGSEHTVSLNELRPSAFLPGARVVVHWPWWGPWTCTVLSYDARKGRIKVSDGWGETKKFDIAEVWLNPIKASEPGNIRKRVYGTLIAVGIGVGAVVGSLITAFFVL
jgi:hypothetical protein